jgi:hypothetical protein
MVLSLNPQSRQSAKLFLQSSELGLPPTPHPLANVSSPLWFWGEGHTRWRERRESTNSDEVTYTKLLFTYLLCDKNPLIKEVVLQVIVFLTKEYFSLLFKIGNDNPHESFFPNNADMGSWEGKTFHTVLAM